MVNYKMALKRPFLDAGNFAIGSLVIFALVAIMVLASIVTVMPVFRQLDLLTRNIIMAVLSSVIFVLPTAYFIKAGLSPSEKMPKFSAIKELMAPAGKLLVILIVYAIPLSIAAHYINILVFGPELVSDLDKIQFEPKAEGGEEAFIKPMLAKLPVYIPIVLLWSIVAWAVILASQFRVMDKKAVSINDAFSPEIFRIAFSPSFLLALIASGLISLGIIVIFALISMILFITIIGALLVPVLLAALMYYLSVIFMSIMGEAYLKAKKSI